MDTVRPIQKIIFGSPGTGKSYQIRTIATEQLGIALEPTTHALQKTVKTVFHPEYTYSDFIGKLQPLTQGGTIIYKFHPGHFLRALGLAYKELISGEENHCLLVIDELNRGNAAAIFGSVFQLLDREADYWSSYEVDVSELEIVGLFTAMGHKATISNDGILQIDGSNFDNFYRQQERELTSNRDGLRILNLLKQRKISIPKNLSIIATINTSDESIYYLDSAFKRRWDWDFVEAPQRFAEIPELIEQTKLIIEEGKTLEWQWCIISLNEFILRNYQNIRRIEDKQIGWWFIMPNSGVIDIQIIKDKLMFYLWDSVFDKDKKPLEKLLSEYLKKPIQLRTYADFVRHTKSFMLAVYDDTPF